MFRQYLKEFWPPYLWQKLSEAEQNAHNLIEDWAEDHSYLCSLCEQAGYTEKEIYGDSHYTPGIQDLADLLFQKIAKN